MKGSKSCKLDLSVRSNLTVVLLLVALPTGATIGDGGKAFNRVWKSNTRSYGQCHHQFEDPNIYAPMFGSLGTAGVHNLTNYLAQKSMKSYLNSSNTSTVLATLIDDRLIDARLEHYAIEERLSKEQCMEARNRTVVQEGIDKHFVFQIEIQNMDVNPRCFRPIARMLALRDDTGWVYPCVNVTGSIEQTIPGIQLTGYKNEGYPTYSIYPTFTYSCFSGKVFFSRSRKDGILSQVSVKSENWGNPYSVVAASKSMQIAASVKQGECYYGPNYVMFSKRDAGKQVLVSYRYEAVSTSRMGEMKTAIPQAGLPIIFPILEGSEEAVPQKPKNLELNFSEELYGGSVLKWKFAK